MNKIRSVHNFQRHIYTMFSCFEFNIDVYNSYFTHTMTSFRRVVRSNFVEGGLGLTTPSGLTLSQTTNFRLFHIERVCRRQF